MQLADQADQFVPKQSINESGSIESAVRGNKRKRDTAFRDERGDENLGTTDVANSTSKLWEDRVCLCPPDQKVPRPRNGELFVPY